VDQQARSGKQVGMQVWQNSNKGLSMRDLRDILSRLSISIPADEEGFIGRECPIPECEGYFKVQPGTGLKGENQPCRCPYCGYGAGADQFFTKAQLEYAKSVAIREVTVAVLKDSSHSSLTIDRQVHWGLVSA
jgi:hypothetical protein